MERVTDHPQPNPTANPPEDLTEPSRDTRETSTQPPEITLPRRLRQFQAGSDHVAIPRQSGHKHRNRKNRR